MLYLETVKFILLFGLIFFSIATVFNLIKCVRRRKGFLPVFAGFVMVFVIIVVYFEIYALFIPALIIFLLTGVLAFVDAIVGKNFSNALAEELERVERDRGLKYIAWKPLLILRAKFGNSVATVLYSTFISSLIAVVFYTIAVAIGLPVSPATAEVLAVIMFFMYCPNIYRALKNVENSSLVR